jgi:hypothetical protein
MCRCCDRRTLARIFSAQPPICAPVSGYEGSSLALFSSVSTVISFAKRRDGATRVPLFICCVHLHMVLIMLVKMKHFAITSCGICSRRRVVICPSGGLSACVSSPLCKNISFHPSGKSSLQLRAIPSHTEGRIAIVTNAGWGAVDAAASCARWGRRADREICERLPGERTRDVAAYGKIVWS